MSWWSDALNKAKQAVSKVVDTVKIVVEKVKEVISKPIAKAKENINVIKESVSKSAKEKAEKAKEEKKKAEEEAKKIAEVKLKKVEQEVKKANEEKAKIEKELSEFETSPFKEQWDIVEAAYKKGEHHLVVAEFAKLLTTPLKEDLVMGTVPISPAGVFSMSSTMALNPAKWEKITSFLSSNWKTLVGGVASVMGTVTFIEFLYEEMLQTQGMGVWVAVSNKQWDLAAKALEEAKPRLEHAKFMINNLGWLSPFTWDVFKRYVEGTEAQYKSFEETIRKKGGYFEDPSEDGNVFDTAEFKKNLTKEIKVDPKNITVKETVEKAPEAPEEVKKIIEEEDYTPEQVTGIKELFADIYKLIVGREVMSDAEFEDLKKKYALYSGEQKLIIDKILSDVKELTKGRAQMSMAEYEELKSNYGVN